MAFRQRWNDMPFMNRVYTYAEIISAMKQNGCERTEENFLAIVRILMESGSHVIYDSYLNRNPEDDTGGELEDYGDDDG